MAASGERRARRGPAPIASFDHDVSDESSPETKQPAALPDIREDGAPAGGGGGGARLAVAGEGRARSLSTPGLTTPAAPRIDISRASSSSHHDSRDSSPELALFAGAGDDNPQALSLGFREDGALDLRSSTEELAFLEGAPPAPLPAAPPPPGPAPPSRRHSRKDSQGSEAALLAVSGRTSRVSSVGSQCSALSALSRVSRLSVVSGASRSPSPHKMLLETSFCGPKPIETDPDICAAAVEHHLLELAQLTAPPTPGPAPPDARDRREVRTEVTVETAPAPATPTPHSAPSAPTPASVATPAEEKNQKECVNRARAEERRARPRLRREPSQPEVYETRNRSKDIIRIKLKPDDEYDDDESESTLPAPGGGRPAERPRDLVRDAPPSPSASRRTPSPGGPAGAGGAAGGSVSRKSSFCSLFKSRETIGSPDSPSEALRRKKSLTEGRARSKSRDRSATPSSAGKLRGSVLSLFKTPRRSATSPAAERSRAASPAPAPPPPPPAERLKYYEAASDGIIHIPLRTPPDERPDDAARSEHAVRVCAAPVPREPARPASAPAAPPACEPARSPHKPLHRTVLPDGSIIIPLHSPTEKSAPCDVTQAQVQSAPAPAPPPAPPLTPDARHCVTAVVEAPLPAGGHERPAWSEPERPTSSPEEARAGEASGEGEPAEKAAGEGGRRARRRERLVFTTHVGSSEQVFSTQFSITKTPSVSSEISGSFPSFHEDVRSPAPPPALRDTHITGAEGGGERGPPVDEEAEGSSSLAATPHSARDSSESEPSSETGRAGGCGGPADAGADAEARGLVVQESFEDELPYVPTTLPLERSLALPMVPVRDRTTHHQSLASVSRPRGAVPAGPPRAPPPPPPAAPRAPHSDKLRIRLPRQPRAAPAPPRPAPPRTRSASRDGAAGDGAGAGAGGEWIDFSEVPERRKQPRRIQALPAAALAADAVVFSYVDPEECRCECHAHNDPPPTPPPHHRSPTLHDRGSPDISAEGVRCAGAGGAPPFTGDLRLADDQHYEHARGVGGGAARRQ